MRKKNYSFPLFIFVCSLGLSITFLSKNASATSYGVPTDDSDLTITNVKSLQQSGIEGDGVSVVLIDTGINTSDISSSTYSYTVTGLDASDGTSYTNDTTNESDHGTKMAEQIFRIAPKSHIYSIKASNDGTTDATTLADAVYKVKDYLDNGTWTNVKVINISMTVDLSSSCSDFVLEPAIDSLKSKHPNVLIVAASGNDTKNGGNSYNFAPACFGSVIAVADTFHEKTDNNPNFDGIQCWGNSGTSHNSDSVDCSANAGSDTLLAPGVDALENGLYYWRLSKMYINKNWTGTSFASAYVTGSVALLCSSDSTQCKNAYDILKASGKSITYNNKSLSRIDVEQADTLMNQKDTVYFNGVTLDQDFTFRPYGDQASSCLENNDSLNFVTLIRNNTVCTSTSVQKTKFQFTYDGRIKTYNSNGDLQCLTATITPYPIAGYSLLLATPYVVVDLEDCADNQNVENSYKYQKFYASSSSWHKIFYVYTDYYNENICLSLLGAQAYHGGEPLVVTDCDRYWSIPRYQQQFVVR